MRNNGRIDCFFGYNVIKKKLRFVITIRSIGVFLNAHKMRKVSFFADQNKTFSVICGNKIKCFQIIFSKKRSEERR